MNSCLLSCTLCSFVKGVYSKKKEFAPKRSKFFPFRVDRFSEWRQSIFLRVSPLKVYHFLNTLLSVDWILKSAHVTPRVKTVSFVCIIKIYL